MPERIGAQSGIGLPVLATRHWATAARPVVGMRPGRRVAERVLNRANIPKIVVGVDGREQLPIGVAPALCTREVASIDEGRRVVCVVVLRRRRTTRIDEGIHTGKVVVVLVLCLRA